MYDVGRTARFLCHFKDVFFYLYSSALQATLAIVSLGVIRFRVKPANFKQVTGMAWSLDRPCIPQYVLGYVGYGIFCHYLNILIILLRLLVKLEDSLALEVHVKIRSFGFGN